MATADLTEQPGETEAQDDWRGTEGMVVGLQGWVSCTAQRGGPNPPKAAGVSEGQRHGSGKGISVWVWICREGEQGLSDLPV